MRGFLFAIAFVSAPLAPFLGCEGGGGGTETEHNVISGRLIAAGNRPVKDAMVLVRPADYLTDPVSSERTDTTIKNTFTDAQGRYQVKDLPAGRYRLEFSTPQDPFGILRDTVVNAAREAIDLGTDSLLAWGSIAGAILPDSGTEASGFVQVYGMERFIMTDAQGRFTVFLPQGVYDIRLSDRQPFRREKIQTKISVRAGEAMNLAPVALEKAAKLGYRLDSGGLQILGLDSTNPVIFDNEQWDNGPDNEYVWAKASSGSLDLRGNIVTRDFHKGASQDEQMKKARQELREARMAGFSHLPEMTLGATALLAWPASGNLDSLTPTRSAGSDLIVAEARKATPDKPLLVVAGGPLTTVAQAWLTDHSIAERMIVAGIYTYQMHPDDTVANYLVARKCRYLQWGRQYIWGGKPDTSLIKSVPPTLMGERVKAYLANNTKFMPFCDIAPVGFLFRRSVWRGADIVKVSRSMDVKPASDLTFDFVDIPEGANDFNGYQTEFYAALTDARAYHALPLPGRVEAEAYASQVKASPLVLDSASWNEGCVYGEGGYADYNANSTGGGFAGTIRYRSANGAKLSLSIDQGPAAAELALPPASEWTEADLPSLAFPGGDHKLRISVSGGTATFDWLDFRQP